MQKNSLKLCKYIENTLSKNKAEEITVIDLKRKTSIADFMIICTGTSNRHLIALSNYLNEDLKKLHLNMLNKKKWQIKQELKIVANNNFLINKLILIRIVF